MVIKLEYAACLPDLSLLRAFRNPRAASEREISTYILKLHYPSSRRPRITAANNSIESASLLLGVTALANTCVLQTL